MVREIKKSNLFSRLKRNIFGPLFFPILLVFSAALTIPVYQFLNTINFDGRQQASPAQPTATISLNPATGTFAPDQLFSVNFIIDGGGQAFNAAQSDIEFSSNLQIQSVEVLSQEAGGCNFTFVNVRKTPTVQNLSFAGAILGGGSVDRCTVMTATFKAQGSGAASIIISNSKVKSRSGHGEIFLSSQNGNYIIDSVTQPTNTPTPTPTLTVTPPLTITPTVTPIVVQPPEPGVYPVATYENAILLSGTKTPEVIVVLVNESANGVIYPSATSWQYQAQLSLGENVFDLVGMDQSGNRSSRKVTISNRKIGDISGDSVVNLTDLSMFGTDWENQEALNYELSDMNSDGVVDLADFSILAAVYEI